MGEGNEAERAITAALGVLAEPGRSMQAIPSRELVRPADVPYQPRRVVQLWRDGPYWTVRPPRRDIVGLMAVVTAALALNALLAVVIGASALSLLGQVGLGLLLVAIFAVCLRLWWVLAGPLSSSRVDRIRATATGLDLRIDGQWQAFAWRDVEQVRRVKVAPSAWGEVVWHLRIGREHVYVPVEGVNASLGEAAKVARRHHRHLPETTHGASDAALSPAERMPGEDEDRGLSKADA